MVLPLHKAETDNLIYGKCH